MVVMVVKNDGINVVLRSISCGGGGIGGNGDVGNRTKRNGYVAE